MTQLELGLGGVRFLTMSSRVEWIKKVRREPVSRTNGYDIWPLPKLMKDEDMVCLYDGQRYEDVEVAEKNIPIIVPSAAQLKAGTATVYGAGPSAMMMEME